jgi:BolA family transcriptional regulator, general stress-responsive regulator
MRSLHSPLQVLTAHNLALFGRLPNSIDRPAWLSHKPQAMRVEDLITRKLTEAFDPQDLRVVDESHQHAGHAGHRPGGETHFRVYIVAETFRGKSRIERHRMINATLSSELAGGVHALAIHAAAPGEGA